MTSWNKIKVSLVLLLCLLILPWLAIVGFIGLLIWMLMENNTEKVNDDHQG